MTFCWELGETYGNRRAGWCGVQIIRKLCGFQVKLPTAASGSVELSQSRFNVVVGVRSSFTANSDPFARSSFRFASPASFDIPRHPTSRGLAASLNAALWTLTLTFGRCRSYRTRRRLWWRRWARERPRRPTTRRRTDWSCATRPPWQETRTDCTPPDSSTRRTSAGSSAAAPPRTGSQSRCHAAPRQWWIRSATAWSTRTGSSGNSGRGTFEGAWVGKDTKLPTPATHNSIHTI